MTGHSRPTGLDPRRRHHRDGVDDGRACTSSERTSSGGSSNVTSATVRDEGPPTDGGSATIGVAAETTGWNPHDSQWPYWSVFVGLVGAGTARDHRRGSQRRSVAGGVVDPERDLRHLHDQGPGQRDVPERRAVRRGGAQAQHRRRDHRSAVGDRAQAARQGGDGDRPDDRAGRPDPTVGDVPEHLHDLAGRAR